MQQPSNGNVVYIDHVGTLIINSGGRGGGYGHRNNDHHGNNNNNDNDGNHSRRYAPQREFQADTLHDSSSNRRKLQILQQRKADRAAYFENNRQSRLNGNNNNSNNQSQDKLYVGDEVLLIGKRTGKVIALGPKPDEEGIFVRILMDNNGDNNNETIWVPIQSVDRIISHGNKFNLTIDDRVIETGGGPGTIMYVGTTHFETGIWFGIVLDGPNGKNNGTVQNQFYFLSEPNYGVMVQVCRLRYIQPLQSEHENKNRNNGNHNGNHSNHQKINSGDYNSEYDTNGSNETSSPKEKESVERSKKSVNDQAAISSNDDEKKDGLHLNQQ